METKMTTNEVLNNIGLKGVADQIDDIIDYATKKRMGPKQILEYVAQIEQKDRVKRSLESRIKKSKIGRLKTMVDFDWGWPKKIDQKQIESAMNLEFLKESKNLIFIAAQGLGKTMITRNICHNAVMAGHSVLFSTASQILLDLASQDTASGLERRLRFYQKPSILAIDEVGYLSYDNRNADLLFQLISRRYEEKSVILTTNLAFSDWPTIFPNTACTTALIDRAIHHAEVIVIEGDSYRRREAQKNAQTKKNVEKQKK
jgi:DNA replication protein DnaC